MLLNKKSIIKWIILLGLMFLVFPLILEASGAV
jgi:hypothetical protein